MPRFIGPLTVTLLALLPWGTGLDAAPPAGGPNAADVARLVRQLGSEQYAEREAASKALGAIGEPALAALNEAALSDDLEVRRRAERLLEALRARARARALDAIKKVGSRGWADGRKR
jgi:HEAT repeat protein